MEDPRRIVQPGVPLQRRAVLGRRRQDCPGGAAAGTERPSRRGLARSRQAALRHPRHARADTDRAQRKPWLHPPDQLGRRPAVPDGATGDARGVSGVNRLGWGILAAFLLLLLAFVAMLGPGRQESAPIPTAAVAIPTTGGPLTIPVAGVAPDQLVDSFGDARGGGGRVHGA